LGEARRAIAPAMSSDWASRCNACIPIVRRGPHRSRWSSTSRFATMPGAAAVALNAARAQERPEVCNQRVERPLIAA
jgi:hypothetical protein